LQKLDFLKECCTHLIFEQNLKATHQSTAVIFTLSPGAATLTRFEKITNNKYKESSPLFVGNIIKVIHL
jgi:hypothetical protein